MGKSSWNGSVCGAVLARGGDKGWAGLEGDGIAAKERKKNECGPGPMRR